MSLSGSFKAGCVRGLAEDKKDNQNPFCGSRIRCGAVSTLGDWVSRYEPMNWHELFFTGLTLKYGLLGCLPLGAQLANKHRGIIQTPVAKGFLVFPDHSAERGSWCVCVCVCLRLPQRRPAPHQQHHSYKACAETADLP